MPDFEDLEDIFIRLFDYVPDTIYILDGLDILDKKHGKPLLKLIQSLFCGSSIRLRIMLLSRGQIPGYVDMTTFMPGIHQISTSSNVM